MLNFHRIPSFLKREYGRTLELALLLAAGHMIAAGLVCARSNPLFSPAGSYGSILILLAAAPLLGWGCCRETVGRLETAADFGKPRNLVFCGVTLLFSAFGVTRHWEAVRFSLKPADLTGAAWPVLTVFCCGLLLLSVLLALHLREAARRGELHRYLGALAGVAGLPAAGTVLNFYCVKITKPGLLSISLFALSAELRPGGGSVAVWYSVCKGRADWKAERNLRTPKTVAAVRRNSLKSPATADRPPLQSARKRGTAWTEIRRAKPL